MYKFHIESEIQNAFPSVIKALDATGLSFYIKDSTLQYIHANQNFFDLLGAKKIKKLSDDKLYPSDLSDEFAQIESRILTTQIGSKQEHVVVTKNQDEKILKYNRSVYVDGNKIYLIGVIDDITESKQDEQIKAFQKVLTGEEMYEKVLNRFSTYIFNNTEINEILKGVSKLCLELLDLEDISIFLYNFDKRVIEQKYTYGSTGSEMIDYSQFLSLKVGEGLVGAAAEQKRTILSNNLSQDERYIPDVLKSKSELAVPIIYEKKLIGVIDSESTEKNFYTPRHIQLLEGIAGLLAIKLNELHNLDLLKEQSSRLTAFIENSPVAQVMLDKNLNYLAISQSWISTFNLDSSIDYIGKNHLNVTPNLPDEWRAKIKDALHGQASSIERELYVRKTGEKEWYSGKATPWFNPTDNSIGGIIISAEIITEKVKQENNFIEAVDELHEAREYGRLFSWEFNPVEGRFIWSENISFEGYGIKSDLKNVSLFDLIDPIYMADFNSKISKAIDDRSNFEIVHPIIIDNKKLWLHTRGKVVVSDGQIVRIHGTAQNVTEQMSHEESLRLKNEELTQINIELDQFVYKTAHDLRAPLTNLLGLINIMKHETNLDLLNSYFELQEKSVEKLDAFIHKITDYTKNTRLLVSSSKINFYKLADEVFSEYLFYNNSEKIEKVIDIQENIEIYSDPERLRVILSNLVSNSIKFADINKSCPSLAVQVLAEGQEIVLKVKDNGIGIKDSIKDRVFDMFFRGHNTADGAGIGLYIVKETVKKLNGKISLTSTLNKETTVEVRLPNLLPLNKE